MVKITSVLRTRDTTLSAAFMTKFVSGHFRTSSRVPTKSFDPPTADIDATARDIRFVPIFVMDGRRM